VNVVRVALYARRSTAEHQAASLDVQTEEARRFCDARGWSIVEVFCEDSVSRAEFVNRPALGKLLAAATSKPRSIDAVVMRDDSRLGGDLYRSGMVLQELHDAGVEVWYYATGERVRFDDPTLKLVSAVKLYASEVERLKISGRVREHLENRARKGQNVGGRVYGYDNVRVDGRTEYRINADEAEVVRELFERHAKGEGVRTIAKALNERGVPAPRAGARGSGSWSPSCVHAMLRRERYRGVLEWGRIGGEYRGGTRVTIERPDDQLVRVERADLAIVSDAVWERAQSRIVETREGVTRRYGRAPAYLLSGIGRCVACGGPIAVNTGKYGSKRIKVYLCGWNRDRGKAVCPVSVRRPVEDIDHAVVSFVRENVMSPAVVDAILDGVRRRIETGVAGPREEEAEARRTLARLEAETARLTAALASSDAAPAAVLAAIAEREAKATDVRARLDVLGRSVAPIMPRWADIEAKLREEFESLGALYGSDTASARRALQTLVVGPMRFSAAVIAGRPAWHVEADLNVPGVSVLSTTPMGIEPMLPT
jgi:site-specific DNA recombinase